jgi:hypothetical protein
MQYSQIMNILATSNRDDWFFHVENSVYTYKDDVNLRIEQGEIDFNNKFVGEDWATKHPDSSAHKVKFNVFYNASLIADYTLVSVDGCRATLPMPKLGTTIVSKFDYHFASLVEEPDTLNEYMGRARLTVEA